MLPWGHAALGYLCFSLWRRLRGLTPSSGPLVVALLVGTQFPDLVDKPLAWTFGVLPSGRSLGHTLVVLVPITALYIVFLRRRASSETQSQAVPRPSTLGGAFLFGWYTHLLGDSWQVLVGRADCASFLLWPITPLCPYDESSSVVAHLLAVELTVGTQIGLVVTAVAFVVWILDGTPGVDLLRSLRNRRRER